MLASRGSAEAAVDVHGTADLDLLAGPAAEELLRAVLAAEGVGLEAWERHAVHHRPGVGVTVGWTVTWRQGSTRGEEYLLGTTAPVAPRRAAAASAHHAGASTDLPAGVQRVEVDGRTVHVWRHPADPALPGLVAASSAEHLGAVLGSPVLALELVTYRPLRRAVLRARLAQRTLYLKVVRPHTAAMLHARHGLLLDAGLPVAPARLLADGLLVLDEVPGEPLTVALAADGAQAVGPRAVLDLLDTLPPQLLDLPRRPSWAERVRDHAAAARAALPGQAERVDRLTTELVELMAASDPGPVVPTHGDLHDANLLLAGAEVVGLLDVDAVGPGHRVDDLACLLGHLSVLPAMAPEVHRHVPATVRRWTQALEAGVDPVALRARAGAVALSLVAGARREGAEDGLREDGLRDAEGRLAAAERWADAARDMTAPLVPRRDQTRDQGGGPGV
ncbi:aminoglycoside phosphotransferase family protein [Actinotalea sp. BY-33]|uniref:Aminoglycoside phosphotransferase family protein n=1 Tax=Actinotalea soli TaxID=2819234 RepID=A0A939RU98_9CELL|nr:aminoglycoside phosphotransferase family protein [Actinotalea soli]MBO1752379.1 aminoglycoside phosphotransferase family protein [Actinotalea soli]